MADEKPPVTTPEATTGAPAEAPKVEVIIPGVPKAPEAPKTPPGEPQKPPVESEKPSEAEESDPKRILFELELENGEKRQITAEEAAHAVTLTERANTIIANYEAFMTRQKALDKLAVSKPLHFALNKIAEALDGDREAAYEYLMRHVEAAHEEKAAEDELPEPEKNAKKLQRKLQAKEERLKALEAQRQKEAKTSAALERLTRLNNQWNAIIKEYGLPNTREARRYMLEDLQKQRAAGRHPNVHEAATKAKAHFEKREEGLLKVVDKERLKKTRPDVMESLKSEILEQIKKERETEEKKTPSTPSPARQESLEKRLPLTRW